MLPKQFDELKLTGSLPSPTGVGMAILRITSGDDFSIRDVAQALSSDPGLTGRILRLANSAKSTGEEPARTVEQATMRLGVRVVRNVALGFNLVSSNRAGPCQGFDYDAYWSHSLACAVSAQALAPSFPGIDPAEAFTCALLAGVGRLALASIHPEAFTEILEKAEGKTREDLMALEQQAFELDHCELSVAMLRDWMMPEEVCAAVGEVEIYQPGTIQRHGATGPLVELLWCSSTLAAGLLGAGGFESGLWHVGEEGLDTVRERLLLQEEPFAELCDQVAESWREWGSVLQVNVPAELDREELIRKARSLRQERSPVETEESPAVPSRGKPLHILAVDDDRVALRLLVRHLTQEGHSVVTAKDGEEALSLALEIAPDLILTDWMMPKMDGVELCRALRRTEVGRSIVLLVLTGQDQQDQIVEAFDAGADDYVVKPFNPKVLMARVRAAQRVIELREQVELDKAEKTKQVAKMAVLNRKLRSAALTDPLTGVPNRRFATRCLEQEVAQAHRNEAPLSVIMVDIDHFKVVNDEFGHDVGDIVLRETSAILRRSTRRGDVICRLGGEEFLVICRGSDLGDATASAERLRLAVEGHCIRSGGFGRAVTVSMGVAELSETGGSVDDLLKSSDRRVYIAKALGRNQVVSGEDGVQSLSA